MFMAAVAMLAMSAIPSFSAPLVSDANPVGTNSRPFIVERSVATRAQELAAERERESVERWTTGATVLLAIFTALLWVANIWLVLESRRVSRRQAQDTRDTINVGRESAAAMQQVAEATRNNAALVQDMMQKQMRAYLNVDLGTAIYQDDRNIFEAKPLITNFGLTPARNVRFRIHADVLDGTATDFRVPPVGELLTGDATMSPRQTRSISGYIGRRLPDAEVEEVKSGLKRRLHGWGRIAYEDVFGKQHDTLFCVSYYFFEDQQGQMRVDGSFPPTHNSST